MLKTIMMGALAALFFMTPAYAENPTATDKYEAAKEQSYARQGVDKRQAAISAKAREQIAQEGPSAEDLNEVMPAAGEEPEITPDNSVELNN